MVSKNITEDLFNLVIKDALNIHRQLNRVKKISESNYYNLVLDIISSLLNELTYLVSPNILKDFDIFKFVVLWQEMVADFDMVENADICIYCSNLIDKKIQQYIEYAVDNEMYEAAHNIKRFINIRYNYIKKD